MPIYNMARQQKYIIIALCTDDSLAGATHTSLHEELHDTLRK